MPDFVTLADVDQAVRLVETQYPGITPEDLTFAVVLEGEPPYAVALLYKPTKGNGIEKEFLRIGTADILTPTKEN
jgi:hypothetical protein